MKTIKIELDDVPASLLAVLGDGDPERAITKILDHAQQGVYRPGAWERDWLCVAFGDEWVERLEPGCPYTGDPRYAAIFQRPKPTT